METINLLAKGQDAWEQKFPVERTFPLRSGRLREPSWPRPEDEPGPA